MTNQRRQADSAALEAAIKIYRLWEREQLILCEEPTTAGIEAVENLVRSILGPYLNPTVGKKLGDGKRAR